jgi:hypothetical protein
MPRNSPFVKYSDAHTSIHGMESETSVGCRSKNMFLIRRNTAKYIRAMIFN